METAIVKVDPLLDWNTEPGGRTYSKYPATGIPIPAHPQLKNLYNEFFDYAYQGWNDNSEPTDKFVTRVEGLYGKLSDDVLDYLMTCPYKAGSRAAMLKDDPNHYD